MPDNNRVEDVDDPKREAELRSQLLDRVMRKQSRFLVPTVILIVAASAQYYLRSVAFPRGADWLLAGAVGLVAGLLVDVLLIRARLNAAIQILLGTRHDR
jgi:hypothetical protein